MISIYHLVFIVILLGVILEGVTRKKYNKFFCLTYLFLSILVTFRYGQGTDYFNYWSIYDTVPSIARQGFWTFWNSPHFGQIGWRLIISIFKSFGVGFVAITSIISAIDMLFLFIFIRKYYQYRFLALFLAYHTFILSYILNTQKQGLMMCIFLAVVFPLYLKNDLIKYTIGVLLLTTIHKIAPVYLALIAFKKIGFLRNRKTQFALIGFFWAIGFGICIVLGIRPPIAVIERLGMFVLVQIIYMSYRDKESLPSYFQDMMNIYAFSMMLYGLFQSEFLMVSVSRTAILGKVFEISIIGILMLHVNKNRGIVYLGIVSMVCVMYVKNINMYLTEGTYNSKYSFINYPYISVLDIGDIANYRYVNYNSTYSEE